MMAEGPCGVAVHQFHVDPIDEELRPNRSATRVRHRSKSFWQASGRDHQHQDAEANRKNVGDVVQNDECA